MARTRVIPGLNTDEYVSLAWARGIFEDAKGRSKKAMYQIMVVMVIWWGILYWLYGPLPTSIPFDFWFVCVSFPTRPPTSDGILLGLIKGSIGGAAILLVGTLYWWQPIREKLANRVRQKIIGDPYIWPLVRNHDQALANKVEDFVF